MNEMTASISVYAYDAENGALTEIQSFDLLPEDFVGHRSGAEIEISPDGTFLFASTRSRGSSGPSEQPGLDLLVWFALDAASGLLTLYGRLDTGGLIPRSFAFDSSGVRILVGHQASAQISVFNFSSSGALSQSGWRIETPVPMHLLPVLC
jgi:6-phosphogluconolactonase